MIEPGAPVIYRCVAGWRCAAAVTRVCPEPPKTPGQSLGLEGSVDIAVDAGSREPVALTRIEVVPSAADLRPGTCCLGDGSEYAKRA